MNNDQIAASLFQNVHTSALTARGESQLCEHYSISVVKSQQCFKGKMAQFQFQVLIMTINFFFVAMLLKLVLSVPGKDEQMPHGLSRQI